MIYDGVERASAGLYLLKGEREETEKDEEDSGRGDRRGAPEGGIRVRGIDRERHVRDKKVSQIVGTDKAQSARESDEYR